MKKPTGELTEIQHDIVEFVWQAGRPCTHSDIWQTVGQPKLAARTTIQTIVNRLVARGWLKRVVTSEGLAFEAVQPASVGAEKVAHRVLERFFDGSPTRLMRSLVGSTPFDADEARRLRKLLDDWEARHAD